MLENLTFTEHYSDPLEQEGRGGESMGLAYLVLYLGTMREHFHEIYSILVLQDYLSLNKAVAYVSWSRSAFLHHHEMTVPNESEPIVFLESLAM